jgi:hypothetical protein
VAPSPDVNGSWWASIAIRLFAGLADANGPDLLDDWLDGLLVADPPVDLDHHVWAALGGGDIELRTTLSSGDAARAVAPLLGHLGADDGELEVLASTGRRLDPDALTFTCRQGGGTAVLGWEVAGPLPLAEAFAIAGVGRAGDAVLEWAEQDEIVAVAAAGRSLADGEATLRFEVVTASVEESLAVALALWKTEQVTPPPDDALVAFMDAASAHLAVEIRCTDAEVRRLSVVAAPAEGGVMAALDLAAACGVDDAAPRLAKLQAALRIEDPAALRLSTTAAGTVAAAGWPAPTSAAAPAVADL